MKVPIIVGTIALAVVFGYGMYASNFTVYLGNDPNACNNCHVMDQAYEGWYHGGHKIRADCTECHTPHDFVPKYLMKAYSGARHVTMFSTGLIPEEIRATQLTKDIVQANCIRCHEETVSEIGDGQMDSGRYCVECHRSVAHGQRGISIMPAQDVNLYPNPYSR
jgi:cytochrome c nitrite reductase small subunit